MFDRPVRLVWLALVALVTAGLVYGYVVELEGLPRWAEGSLAGSLTVLFAWGLTVRAGGRPWLTALLCLVLVVIGWVTAWEPLLAGGAVVTAVLAGALAVMSTQPASTFQEAVRESVVATLVAVVGAFGVYVYARNVEVDDERLGYVVLALALAGALALVFRLGAGLHGMGRRGAVITVIALVFLAVALGYAEALSRWGSEGLNRSLDDFRLGVRDTLHGVPHPIAALLGYPALVWGVFMRARRRQGWWVCAFGVAATANAATWLVDPAVGWRSTALSALYSLVVGLVLGYLLIRAEQSFTGTHGARARRDEEASAHRPEPGRFEPLR